MKIQGVLTAWLIMAASGLTAQCPTAGFSNNAPVCGGQAIQLQNTSSGATEYFWDFSAGDFENPVADTSVIAGQVQTPSCVFPVSDPTGDYAFGCSRDDNRLVRYDYANGYANGVTSITDLGNVFSQVPSPNGMVFRQEAGTWYALVVSVFNNSLSRVEFGNGLGNAPTAASIILTNGLAFPRGIDLTSDASGNLFAIVANFTGNSVSVIGFGNSILNAPSLLGAYATPGSGPMDVTWVRECGHWYALLLCYSSSDVQLLDFGNDPGSTPASAVQLVSGLSNPSSLSVVDDNARWYVLTSNSSTGKISIHLLGATLSAPSPVLTGELPLGTGSPTGLNMIRQGTRWYGFVMMESLNTLITLRYDDPGSIGMPTSTDFEPSGVTFTVGGTYSVVLEATDAAGNSDRHQEQLQILPAPIVGFGFFNTCFGDFTVFTDSTVLSQSTIQSWHWDFGNGDTSVDQNPLYYFTAAADYPVTLTVASSNGCVNELTQTVRIHPRPTAAFSASGGCSETETPFVNLSTIASGAIVSSLWEFGNGDTSDLMDPPYAYPSGGTYQVQLTVTSDAGCTSSIQQSTTIDDRPDGAFEASNTCIGQTVQFVNLTSVTGATITSIDWDFGDGNTSQQSNPSHSYPSTVSNYPVTLIVIASNGCSDTVVNDIRINEIPTANFLFSPTTACQGNNVQFSDFSSVNGDTISAWRWDFGDGTFDSIQNPVHRFTTSGAITVSLIAYAPSNCPSAIFQQTVNVLESPVADFIATEVCAGSPTQFTNLSTVPAGSVIALTSWDFGEGGTAQSYSPAYQYGYAGSYPVILRITSDFGCVAVDTQYVTVHGLPTADFTVVNPCNNQNVQFNNLSTADSLSSLTSYTWNFGDFANPNNTSQNEDPTHLYANTGTYPVFLIATTDRGCSDTLIRNIDIVQSAPAQFTYSPTCFGDLMEFFNPGSALDSAYLWNFGDNQTNQLQEPAHYYTFPGTYTVTLTVISTSGCATTNTKQVTVSPIPVANFSTPPACIGTWYTFRDTSTIASGAITQWLWNIDGIGPIDSVRAPSYTFQDTGSYPVTLTVLSDIGCSNSVRRTVRVYPLPVASFDFDPQFGNPPLEVNFTNLSQGAQSYQWDFGDGSAFSTDLAPLHLYTDTGLYTIRQVVISPFGCVDTSERTIYIIRPILDVAVTDDSSYFDGDYFHVVSRLTNLGTRRIDSVFVEAQLENGSKIREQAHIVLNNGPDGSVWYPFIASFYVGSSRDFRYYCVRAVEPNGESDAVPGNNERCNARQRELTVSTPFPNPFDESLNIRIMLPFNDELNITLYDQYGHTAGILFDGKAEKGSLSLRMNTSQLADGVYTLRVQFRDAVEVKQVVKTRVNR